MRKETDGDGFVQTQIIGLLSWAKYQRKRIKAGALNEERKRQFEELLDSRSDEHTGGRRKKISDPELWQ